MKRILALLLFLSPAVQAIVIDNGIPAGTVGHFSVDVLAGGDTDNATITAVPINSAESVTTDVVFDYASFVDPGRDDGGIRLSASANLVGPTVDPDEPNTVTSSGTFIGQSGEVFWFATSSIKPRSQLMTTRYVFVATGDDPIGPLRVLQYLDEDVNLDEGGNGFSDNVFLPLGSADFGDLSLYTFGNVQVIGVRQGGSESFESFFAGWAAGPFRDIFDRITEEFGAGQPIARGGVIENLPPINHLQLGPSFGPADITSVLAWDINPNTFFAEVITVLGGEEAAPVPPVASFVATPAIGTAPLTVAFDGSGSTDSDGAIVTHRWDFGDSTPLANGPIQSHIYTEPGTYSAQLVVRDDSGLVRSSIQQIGVEVPPPPPPGPPPVTPANPGAPIVCQGTACGVPLTCNLDAQCTVRATIFVRTRGGLSNGDAAVTASRTIKLAASVANIPPSQTATVRPRLTTRGKGLLQASRAGGKKRFSGTLQLRNVITGTVISNTPVRVRLR